MEKEINFRVTKKEGDKTCFTDGEITIMTDRVSVCEGKHHLNDPKMAKAAFTCCGERYIINNADGISTVEDWYLHELLPKFQMIRLLRYAIPV